jgi:hypothetical protein
VAAFGGGVRGQRNEKTDEDRENYEKSRTTSHLEIINDVDAIRQWRILRRLIQKGVS